MDGKALDKYIDARVRMLVKNLPTTIKVHSEMV